MIASLFFQDLPLFSVCLFGEALPSLEMSTNLESTCESTLRTLFFFFFLLLKEIRPSANTYINITALTRILLLRWLGSSRVA